MSEHRFGEVLIERPRYKGPRGHQSSRRLPDVRRQLKEITEAALEGDLVTAHLIKVRDYKSLADHLGPLKRFLRSSVGRPWDAVYSELTSKVDTNTLLGHHLMSHVWDYVERDMEMREGQPWPKRSRRHWNWSNRWNSRFYVHPETGLLCMPPDYRPSPKPDPRDYWRANDRLHYCQYEGLWYALHFAPLPQDFGPLDTVWDTERGECLTTDLVQHYYGRRVYIRSKQQCSKKEIRQIEQHFDRLTNPALVRAGRSKGKSKGKGKSRRQARSRHGRDREPPISLSASGSGAGAPTAGCDGSIPSREAFTHNFTNNLEIAASG